MAVEPVFPVKEYRRVVRGIGRKRTASLLINEYEDLELLANDLELINTCGDPNVWIVDARGTKWDVKLDILNGTLNETVFTRRED